MTEIENKCLISQQQFQRISELYRHKQIEKIIQINYYFDSIDFYCYRNNETLRIRQIDEKRVLQYKCKKQKLNNTTISEEFQVDVDFLPEIIRVNHIETTYIGNMVTERSTFQFDKYHLFLDKNMYLGNVDYEIEIEAGCIDDIPESIGDIFFTEVNKGKYARFVDALSELHQIYNFNDVNNIL